MLFQRLHTGPEKAELQELNARLCDYVCRVRELERENLLLEEELRGRRWQRGLGAEGQARRAEEARRLRQQLDELSWATALAEGERDALRRELRELQLLGEEARAARGLLDAELGAQRRELQEALGARAALEALLGRLQAERRGLDAAHERDVRELRARAAGLTLRYGARASGPAAASPPLREVHDRYALLVAESWRETVQLYEDEVRELEAALRRGDESRRQAEEETRLCAQEAEALQRQALELEQLRALLEDELLRMREAYELQAKERQSAIAGLEDEKAALTLAMADRLRDYQELVRVKTSLSLEVATYRALLEGESNPEILILTERIENLPQEFTNTSYQYTDSALRRENERNLFLRQKPPSGRLHRRPATRLNMRAPLITQTGMGGAAGRGPPGSPRPTTRREFAEEKTTYSHTSFGTFPPTPGRLRSTEVQVQTFPGPARTAGTKAAPAGVAGESTPGRGPWSHDDERTVIGGEKTEAKAAREQEGGGRGALGAKREEKMFFDSKEKASEERNLRWEELTKLDKEARERGHPRKGVTADAKGPSGEPGAGRRQVPVRVEAPQSSGPEGTPGGDQTPPERDTGAGPGRRLQRREARFRLGAGDTGDPVTESIAENIVSGVLRQFAQPPGADAPPDPFPDTKVTHVSRKELPDERRTTTEIVVESRLSEDLDVVDAAGLGQLLGEDARGEAAERVVRDVLQLGLEGRAGRARVVSVEVVEGPLSCVGGAAADAGPTPCRVEEAEDASPASPGPAGAAGRRRGEPPPPPRGDATRVEEVTEAGDSDGEQSYFVSTPEEGPEPDADPVYGRIHVAEAATVRYSWQDEIVPGPRRRARSDDDAWGETVVEPLDVPEPSPERDTGPPWGERGGSGEFHAEATVVEKEIEIRPALHTALRGGGDQEPRRQLAAVLGQLGDSLPGRVREELAAATREGGRGPATVSVDVQKVRAAGGGGGGGAVTLVAQVNLSETVDADRLDLEALSRDEGGEIEKAVESVVRGALAEGPAPGSRGRDAAVTVSASGFGFKRWATQELYSPAGDDGGGGDGGDDGDGGRAPRGTHRAASQGPVSATVEVTSPRGFAQAHVLEDISQSVRHVRLGPTGTWRTERGSPEGHTAQVLEVDVSHIEATPSWTPEATAGPAGTEAEAHGVSDRGTWRDAGRRGDPAASVSAQGTEQAEFDRTVQLQRMVDQRSVVSEEKKVAVLYLDNQGEDEEGDWF